MMTPLTLGLVSAALIAIGLGLVLRDYWRPSKTDPALPAAPKEPTQRPAARGPAAGPTAAQGQAADKESNSNVTIVQRTKPPTKRSLQPLPEPARASAIPAGDSPAFDQLRSVIEAISSEAHADTTAPHTEGQRWPAVETRWPTVGAEIDTAAADLNTLLVAVDMQLGPAGETGWSFKNRGYGSFRRVLLGGRSVAWLRCELTHSGQITFKTRAHTVEQALLNASAAMPADGARARTILDGLSKAVRPSAEFAAWIKPKQTAEAQAGSDAWSEVASVATQALAIAGTALREAGADVAEQAPPSWDATTGRQRWPLSIRVGGNLIGRVDVDLVRRALDVSVDNPDRSDLARRRRVDTLGLTPHALAEAIASCAWPTVADVLQRPDTNALGYAG